MNVRSACKLTIEELIEMLGRRTNKPGRVDRASHTETTMPPRPFAPPKFFLATSATTADEVTTPENPEAVMNPTSILQAGSSTSPAAYHHHVLGGGPVPFSSSGTSGGDDWRSMGRRPWEAPRPIGLGLAGALIGKATGAASTILAGQYSARRCLSPGEMEASEDYTRVIARGPNARTVHIFHDHVGAGTGGLSAGCGEGEFLRWCHGCSKDLAQGKDIFMYRGEMAFCSHECRYRKVLFDEKLYAD